MQLALIPFAYFSSLRWFGSFRWIGLDFIRPRGEAVSESFLLLSKSWRIGAHGFYACSLEGQIDGMRAGRGGPMPDAFGHGDHLAGA
jgi:hypothetical protein